MPTNNLLPIPTITTNQFTSFKDIAIVAAPAVIGYVIGGKNGMWLGLIGTAVVIGYYVVNIGKGGM